MKNFECRRVTFIILRFLVRYSISSKPKRSPKIDTTVPRMQLVGANLAPQVTGLDQLPGKKPLST
jgi:hypothetical protein